MSVIETNQIDFIGTDKKTGEVIITISDHLDWEDEYEHLLILQEKINMYISFIESGQIYEEYPASLNSKIIIGISCKYELTELANKFLENVRSILETINVGLKQNYVCLVSNY